MQIETLLPDTLVQLVGALLLVAAALFPIVNPLGMAPIFLSYTAGLDEDTRIVLSRRIAWNSFVLATVSLFIGSHVLRFFGLSLPAVQIGGGLVVAATGWRILHRGAEERGHHGPGASPDAALASAFYPLTMPLTVGPGSIAVMLTIGSNAPQPAAGNAYLLPEAAGALAGVAAVALSIYVSYRYAEPILRRLGESGVNVMLRLSAFILLCLGVQILLNGLRAMRLPA
jgi:multiple antibiotic resistance protein